MSQTFNIYSAVVRFFSESILYWVAHLEPFRITMPHVSSHRYSHPVI